MAQVAEHLPSKLEALSSKPELTKKEIRFLHFQTLRKAM
jgi:hypothetical protein